MVFPLNIIQSWLLMRDVEFAEMRGVAMQLLVRLRIRDSLAGMLSAAMDTCQNQLERTNSMHY